MKKLLILLLPFLLVGCVTVNVTEDPDDKEDDKIIQEIEENDVPKETTSIIDDLKARNFIIKSDPDDDEIDLTTVVSWLEAELEDQEEYTIITFKTAEDAKTGFENLKAHEQLDSDDILSEQDGIFIQEDTDGSIEAMILHENQIVNAEREDGNLDLILKQFEDWNLK